jgi:hypothetical protein
VLLPRQQAKLARGAKDKEHAMSQTPSTAFAVIGIDIGKNSFHVAMRILRACHKEADDWDLGGLLPVQRRSDSFENAADGAREEFPPLHVLP